MALSESWHLRSRARECAATRRHFVAGEMIVTALFPDPESSGYLRRDYGLEAWQARDADEEPPFSHWRTRFVPAGGDKPAPPQKEDPEDILRRMVEEDADHTENTRYILAVMLERRKLLRETDTQRTPTGILRIYENRKTGEVYIVKDPNVPLSAVDALQQEVMELLEARTQPAATGETAAPGEPAEAADAPELSEPAAPEDAAEAAPEDPLEDPLEVSAPPPPEAADTP